MLRKSLMTSAGVLIASAACNAAGAQSLDYDVMTELFGEAVTNSATGKPQRASEVPAAMVIITQEDIQRLPERDIPGILRHYAGVDMARWTAGAQDVGIRGYNQPLSPRLLVLIDGRQVYLDHFGYTAWRTLPVQLSEIQQIELIKGPQSALYGFNAVSGVVNIITKDPLKHDTSFNVTANTTFEGTDEVNAVLSYNMNDKIGIRLSAGVGQEKEYGYNNTYLNDADNFFATYSYDAAEDIQLSGTMNFQFAPNTTGMIELSHAHVNQMDMQPNFFTANARYRLFSARGRVESDTDWGLISASLYRNTGTLTSVGSSFAVADPEYIQPSKNTVTVFQLQDLFQVGTSNTFRIGFEWRSNVLESSPDPRNGDTQYKVLSLSGMWDRAITPTLRSTVAVRVDRLDLERTGTVDDIYWFTAADFDREITEPSYNLGLVWNKGEMGIFRANASRGVQTPSLSEFGLTQLTGSPTAVSILDAGNPLIKPTIVQNYEIGWDRALKTLADMRLSVFYQKSEDLKSFLSYHPTLNPPDAPEVSTRFDNVGESSAWGIELDLSGDAPFNLDWGINYTYEKVNDDLVGVFGVFDRPYYTPGQVVRNRYTGFEDSTPNHKVNARVNWTKDNWHLGVFGNYVDEVTYPDRWLISNGRTYDTDVSAYLALSFRADYRVNDHLALNVIGRNVNFGNDGVRTNRATREESSIWAGISADF
ncbi:TonB-dependent receptor plug domain-containing protein [Woodsholea maritima]|uniref:TonB-dependent receptor plug domain-containing protein n=1 Tax=Woodsholea maritima TaxID=240237 RepID=UPI00036E5CB1|nr:TonB-dependent receptor [Woodsholea maritima]